MMTGGLNTMNPVKEGLKRIRITKRNNTSTIHPC